jgi:CubicO group peptidase (beta-lactamase class C family)
MSFLTAVAAFIAILTLGNSLVAAQPLEGLDDYVEAARNEWQVPGLAIAIVKDGESVLTRGYGVRKVGGDHAVDAETIFPIASITKNFTATTIALLVEESKLDWDDPVTTHLPNLKFSDEYRTKNVTIRDLLCHRTGLERGDLLPRRGDVSIDDIVHRIRFLQPASAFRSKWGYNNLMYYAAGAVAAKASGLSWEDLMAEKLLKPLGMTSTATASSRIRSENRSHRHRLLAGKVVPATPGGLELSVSPAGSIQSNAVDMAKWLIAALATGGADDQLLESATRREMQSIQMSIPAIWDRTGNPYAARFYGWGLGWTVLDYRGRKVCYHAGSAGTMLAVIPEENIGVVILTNQEWTNLAGMLMYDVFDAYLIGPDKAWERGKWDFWKKADPHPDLGRRRDLKKAEAKRNSEIPANLPLPRYAGRYECDLYGDMVVSYNGGKLLLRYGANQAAAATHWEADTFYIRRPVHEDASVDWLVSFAVDGQRATALSIERLGWHEALPRFVRSDD